VGKHFEKMELTFNKIGDNQMEQQQNQLEMNVDILIKTLGEKDIAIVSLQSLVQKLIEKIKVLEEKSTEIVKE
jgi:hypothetical protein